MGEFHRIYNFGDFELITVDFEVKGLKVKVTIRPYVVYKLEAYASTVIDGCPSSSVSFQFTNFTCFVNFYFVGAVWSYLSVF